MTKPTNNTLRPAAPTSAASDPSKVAKPQSSVAPTPNATAVNSVAKKTVSEFPEALRKPFKDPVNYTRERSQTVSNATTQKDEQKHGSGLWRDYLDESPSKKAPAEPANVSKPQPETSASSSPTASVADRIAKLKTGKTASEEFPDVLRRPFRPLAANFIRERANSTLRTRTTATAQPSPQESKAATLRGVRSSIRPDMPIKAAAEHKPSTLTSDSEKGRLRRVADAEKHASQLWQTYLDLPEAPKKKKIRRSNSVNFVPSTALVDGKLSKKVNAVSARQLRPGTVMEGAANKNSSHSSPTKNVGKQEAETTTPHARPQLRRSHSSRNLFVNDVQDEKVVQNPLFGLHKTKINELKTYFALPLMSLQAKRTSTATASSSNVKFFDLVEAEKLLSDCLKQCPAQSPEIDEIIKIMGEFRKLGAEHQNILQKLLMLSLLNSKDLSSLQPFMKSYLTHIDERTIDFAKDAVPKLIELVNERAKSKEQRESMILTVLSNYTEADMEDPDSLPATLFRGPELSSALCKEYGLYLIKNQLDGLNNAIIKEIKKSNLSQFNLGTTLTKDQLKKNAPHFIKFATGILKTIFAMELPAAFTSLLEKRRESIIHYFLANSPEGMDECSEKSRAYLSELLFLRIINPYIISLTKSPELKDLNPAEVSRTAILLTKVIQAIANGNKAFNEEHLKPLNSLLASFGKISRESIDRLSNHSVVKK